VNQNRNKFFLSLGFLLFVSIVAYFGNSNKFGFFSDDWYLIYGGLNFGAERFFDVFAIDRPLRGSLQFILFSLFETNIIAYYFLALFIRFIGAISVLWLILLIFKNKYFFATSVAAIFLIYPGFLEQPNAMDYMAHQFTMTFMLLSIVFSIKYFTNKISEKIIFFILSTGFALISYFLMEYYIGMEAFRFLFIIYFLWDQKNDPLLSKAKRLFLSIFPFTLSPIIFAIWRVFYFTSLRMNTDVDFLYSNFSNSVILSLFDILKRWLVDIYEITIGAYVIPNTLLIPKLGLRDFGIALLLGMISIVGFLFYSKLIITRNEIDEINPQTTNYDYKRLLIFSLLGLLAAGICLLPINIAEREVSYLFFNRFSFPSVLGVSIFLLGIITSFQNKKIQLTAISILLFSSVITQYANNVRFSLEWSETKNFWQNFAWRVPDLENGTTLTGLRSSPIYEGYFIWSPTNLIYRPNSRDITISAEVLNKDIVKNIALNIPYEKQTRSFYIKHDYNKTLVFTKPTTNSCLRMIDNQQIEISIFDDVLVQLAAPYSRIDLIKPNDSVDEVTFEKLFGNKTNEETWCYYYEQAALARQFQDWERIIELTNFVENKNLHPTDSIEWMPFLQAYAYRGNFEKAEIILDEIIKTPFYQAQACEIFSKKLESETENKDFFAGNEFLKNEFCGIN